jgi:hypothetical protein
MEYRIRISSSSSADSVVAYMQCARLPSSGKLVEVDGIGMTEKEEREEEKKCSNDASFRQDRDLESNEKLSWHSHSRF